MDERKQIEEMANSIASTPIGTVKPDLTLTEMREVYSGAFIGRIAKHLVFEGYRKQTKGEWHWISDDDVMCTTCGRVFNSNDNADAGLSSWRFCPNCGARMKGE